MTEETKQPEAEQQPIAGLKLAPAAADQDGEQAAPSGMTSPFQLARKPAMTGMIIVALFFGGVGGWATFAPLESASIASGQVAVDSRRQTVQHLEGGIIQEILIDEGSIVQQGDVLIRLDTTRAAANLELLRGQYLSAIGSKARLQTERDGADQIAFFAELADEDLTQEERAIIEGQQNVFDTRQRYMNGQRDILDQRVLQLNEQISAFQAQEKAETAQLALIREEIGAVKELVEKGLERKPRLLSLQRAAAEIAGNRGEYRGRMAQVGEQISEVRSQLIDLENQRLNEVTEQLRETEDQIYDLRQRLSAAEDVMLRTDIVAPRSGTVVSLRFHTPGGVIRAGDAVLDMVPSDDRLLIDARVNPLDIDVLTTGMQAQVRLSAYSQRTMPVLGAELIHLSADALTDEATGTSYYTARIEVDADELAAVQDAKLVPGMPAEVMLLTGRRTAMEYLLDPITKSIERGMKER